MTISIGSEIRRMFEEVGRAEGFDRASVPLDPPASGSIGRDLDEGDPAPSGYDKIRLRWRFHEEEERRASVEWEREEAPP